MSSNGPFVFTIEKAQENFNYPNYAIKGAIAALIMGILTTGIAMIFLRTKTKKGEGFLSKTPLFPKKWTIIPPSAEARHQNERSPSQILHKR